MNRTIRLIRDDIIGLYEWIVADDLFRQIQVEDWFKPADYTAALSVWKQNSIIDCGLIHVWFANDELLVALRLKFPEAQIHD